MSNVSNFKCRGNKTSISALVILGRKCTLAASRAAPGESRRAYAARSINVRRKMKQTDGRQTDRRQTVTLRLPLNAARVIILFLLF